MICVPFSSANQRTGSVVRTSTGNAIDYNGAGGYEKLITSNIVGQTILTFRTIFNETFVGTVNPLMEMNDWEQVIANSETNRFSATQTPFVGIRVTNHKVVSNGRNYVGSVDYVRKVTYPNWEDWNSTGDSTQTVEADRTEREANVLDLFTSGMMGQSATKAVLTVSSNNVNHFDSQSTDESDKYTLTWAGIYHVRETKTGARQSQNQRSFHAGCKLTARTPVANGEWKNSFVWPHSDFRQVVPPVNPLVLVYDFGNPLTYVCHPSYWLYRS